MLATARTGRTTHNRRGRDVRFTHARGASRRSGRSRPRRRLAARRRGKREQRGARDRGAVDAAAVRLGRRRPRRDPPPRRRRKPEASPHRGERPGCVRELPDDARRLAARARRRARPGRERDRRARQRQREGNAAGPLRDPPSREPPPQRADVLRPAAGAVLLRDRAERPRAGARRRLLRTDAGSLPVPDDRRRLRGARRPDGEAGRPRPHDDARRPHRRLHRSDREGSDRPRRLRDRRPLRSRRAAEPVHGRARLERTARLHVRRRLQRRLPPGPGERRRAHRPLPRPWLCRRVVVPERLRQQLQRGDLGRGRADGEGALRRDVREAEVHDRLRRLGRRDPAAPDREQLPGHPRRDHPECVVPGLDHARNRAGLPAALAVLRQPGRRRCRLDGRAARRGLGLRHLQLVPVLAPRLRQPHERARGLPHRCARCRRGTTR